MIISGRSVLADEGVLRSHNLPFAFAFLDDVLEAGLHNPVGRTRRRRREAGRGRVDVYDKQASAQCPNAPDMCGHVRGFRGARPKIEVGFYNSFATTPYLPRWINELRIRPVCRAVSPSVPPIPGISESSSEPPADSQLLVMCWYGLPRLSSVRNFGCLGNCRQKNRARCQKRGRYMQHQPCLVLHRSAPSRLPFGDECELRSKCPQWGRMGRFFTTGSGLRSAENSSKYVGFVYIPVALRIVK
jgi:hypothetical protein